MVEQAKKLNSKNITENIFGGLSVTDLSSNWTNLQKQYEERYYFHPPAHKSNLCFRKKFVLAAIEQLELAGNLDGVLDRERKFLEASKVFKFGNKQDIDKDLEGV